MIASLGLPSPYPDILVFALLLYLIFGPLFALWLIVGQHRGRAWAGWLFAFGAVVGGWWAYAASGTHIYFKGDNKIIDNVLKWDDFVLHLSVTIFVFTCLILWAVDVDGDSPRSHKIFGILGAFGIQFLVIAGMWGRKINPGI